MILKTLLAYFSLSVAIATTTHINPQAKHVKPSCPHLVDIFEIRNTVDLIPRLFRRSPLKLKESIVQAMIASLNNESSDAIATFGMFYAERITEKVLLDDCFTHSHTKRNLKEALVMWPTISCFCSITVSTWKSTFRFMKASKIISCELVKLNQCS